MKVIIFGSTGTIGQLLIQQALDKGYQVTAFARKTEKIQIAHQHLTKVKGDVMDFDSVNHAIKNHDVAIVVLGAGRKGIVRSVGTKNIIQAMKQNGIKRLICQSTMGVGDSRGNLNFFWKYMMFGWLLRPAYLDHIQQEKYVRDSDLDWTIVRPGEFTDGELTRHYKHGFSATDKSIKLKISRLDVVDFLLNQITDLRYLHKAPSLSY